MFYFFKRLCHKVVFVLYLFREANMVFKLVPKVAYRCCYRPCCRVSKRAYCVAFYFSLYVPKQFYILLTAVAVLNPVQYFLKPSCTFTARRALPAALVVVEPREVPCITNNTCSIVIYYKST